ncbi:MAG: hypothetical protein EXR71_08465 [Myxococcales bacterium]|nr:hypothetical protein [Myxococcales bacterium]
MWLLLACPEPLSDTAPVEPVARDPQFTSVRVSCDGDAAKWVLDMKADAWTGGGALLLSTDGRYVEEHGFGSYEAAVDGSADHLKLSLAVAGEFQDVHEGSSTWFNCGTPSLQGLLVLRNRDATAPTDCRVFGERPAWWSEWGIGDCAEPVTVEPIP